MEGKYRLARISAAAVVLGSALQYQAENSYSVGEDNSEIVTMQEQKPYRLKIAGVASDGVVVPEVPVAAEGAPGDSHEKP